MKQLKTASLVFSPLVGAFVAGYLLLRLRSLNPRYFALIVIAGLVLSLFNGVMLVIGISKKHE